MKTHGLIDNELKRISEGNMLLNEESNYLQQHPLTIMAIWNALLDRETKAFARELHDDLGQVLTALRMDISLFKLQHQTDEALVDKADGMLALTDRCMLAVCGLINLLRSPNFEHGLATALERLCQDFSKKHEMACTLTISGECICLDDVRTLALFRILHEALTNIAHHAASRTADIAVIQATDGGLHVEIRDDGRGFHVCDATDSKSLGLLLMRESAVALGGQIEIVSEMNVGTTVVLHIPPESLKH